MLGGLIGMASASGLATAKSCAVLVAALALAGCAAHAPDSASGGSGTRALAAAYMAIALPANHRLDRAVNSFNVHARDDLAVAEADLRQEAATERWFDERLLKIAFPSAIAATARALVRANDQRIKLTTEQARAMTISKLLAFDVRHRAADAAVEVQVRIIRRQLGLPPPENS
jgi:hypothetical protein